MATIRILLLTVALIVTLCAAAEAQVTLNTPLVGAHDGQILDCIVTNLWTNDLTVSVTLTDFNGNVLTPVLDTCNGLPMAPRKSCEVVLAPDIGAFCTVVANNSHVVASINSFGPSPNPLVTVVPATK